MAKNFSTSRAKGVAGPLQAIVRRRALIKNRYQTNKRVSATNTGTSTVTDQAI
jgi:hypothetical protein